LTHNSPGAGVAPYQGYEYQIIATAYLAVDLLLARNRADSITVEPANGDDALVELRAVDSEQATSNVHVVEASKRMLVQIKLRNSGHWTQAPFVGLLTGKNSATNPSVSGREWPVKYLENNPETNFVLLTNAQCNPQLRPFVVADICERPAAKSPSRKLPAAVSRVAARIAVAEQLTIPFLRQKACDLLNRYAHVPSRHLNDCFGALEEAVRTRLLGKRPGRWSREELVATAHAHGGFPAGDVVRRLVKPLNYDALASRLDARHALIISGTPPIRLPDRDVPPLKELRVSCLWRYPTSTSRSASSADRIQRRQLTRRFG
jgi:hypothetical protein